MNAVPQDQGRPDTPVSIVRLTNQIVGTTILIGALLFVPAGTLRWPAAWAYLLLTFALSVGLSAWLMRFNPELLAERMSGVGKRDQKTWDKVLLAFVGVGFVAWLVLMGVDRRLGVSHLPLWVKVLGGAMLLLSFSIFYLAFRENNYLSTAVRVQRDRSHVVVSTGPYGVVRHPLYAGYVLYTFGTALLLGSWIGVGVGVLLILLTAYRAVMEERVLRLELEGYGAYMERVRWRFIPHVW